MDKPFRYSTRQWFGKASAGFILGLTLAFAFSGLVAWFGPGGLMSGSAKTQLNMWMIAPIWMTVLSFCFLFRSGAQAWTWLGGINLVLFGILFLGKAVIG